MADLTQLALQADAALAAFYAQASAAGVLWPDDERAITKTLSVVRQYEKRRR